MRWFGRVLLTLIVLLIAAGAVVYFASSARLNRTFAIPDKALALTIPTDSASIARGKHLAFILGCNDCHGAHLAGRVFLDVPPFKLVAPNLTRGQGGAGSTFGDADFVRAIRHGVAPDGRAFLLMPSKQFASLSDEDLADIIAFVKSVPPVDQQQPAEVVKPLGRVLLVLNQLPPPAAELIDHAARPPTRVIPEVSVAYGRYLANIAGCTDCHRATLVGGPVAGVPPSFPKPQNITPAGIGNWTEPDFFRAMRTGTRPDGTAINRFMPWPYFSAMSDDELRALREYLRSVPPKT